MGVSFFERMQGVLFGLDGAPSPIDFALKCEASHLRQVLRDGVLHVSGALSAPPWATDAPALGTVRLDPANRALHYALTFQGDDDRPLRLVGRKDTSPWRPIAGMTRLATSLHATDPTGRERLVALGTMRFELADLPAFLASFSPATSARVAPLLRPALDGAPAVDPLGPSDLVRWRAIAELVVAPGRVVPAPGDATFQRLREVLRALPAPLRRATRLGLRALDASARLTHGRPLSALAPDARRDAFTRLERLGVVDAVRPLFAPLMIAHFGREDYQRGVGIAPPTRPAPEPAPPYLVNAHTPDALAAHEEIPCDVVVIGSGAGGGPVAARLAELGLAVAVVEEGRWISRGDLGEGVDARMFALWRDHGMRLAVSNAIVSVPTGVSVGGTTTINSGTCLRPDAAVFAAWRAAGLPDALSEEALAPHYEAVARELQIAPADPRYVGALGDRLGAACAALAAEGAPSTHGPLLRNAPSCDGQGVCMYGCPTQAKRSSDVTWMPRALAAGAHAFTGMRATRLLTRGDRVVGVIARGADRYGAPRRLVLRARAVVVAMRALESPLFLADNGVRSPRLGRGLSIHPALGALARFDASLGPTWRAIPQGYGVHGLVDPRIRFEGSTTLPHLGAAALPLRGEALTRWMDAWDHVGHFGFMVRDRNRGRVVRGPGGRGVVHYPVDRDLVRLMTRGNAMLAELLLRAGAREVVGQIAGLPIARSVEQARALAHAPVRARQIRTIGFHPLGTCAMGVDARHGVVDADHRVFGTHGLYVIDGASVPTSLGVNPQWTIMALALRGVEGVARALA